MSIIRLVTIIWWASIISRMIGNLDSFILVMKMARVISTITLLQEMGILPRTTSCNLQCKVCSRQLRPYLTNSNCHYFECSNCKTKTFVLNNTVLLNSNNKVQEFVVLMHLFSTNHRMYKTARKEVQGSCREASSRGRWGRQWWGGSWEVLLLRLCLLQSYNPSKRLLIFIFR